MSGRGLLLIIITALCVVVSNLLIRAELLRAGSFSFSLSAIKSQILAWIGQPSMILGFILYGLATLIWFRVMATENLSASYPLLISLTFVLVTIGSVVFFHEGISWQKVLGLGVILTGFVLVARA
ncbi:MAG: hypothetical protein L0229_06280 [Blastocatellia bacterium]|nr:hypothetical protein [Blastocatellia bacterium]